MPTPGAVIVSCRGTALAEAERRLFARTNPFGLIIFRRNVESPAQLAALTGEFRGCVGRSDAPVLIDQEGGRVARLAPPHWSALPPAAELGELFRHDPDLAEQQARQRGRLLADQLRPLGITVNCAPVLDLRRPETTAAIGDRAFSGNPQTVARLGRALAEGLRAGGVLPVIKHMPGHGRATADSHHLLPVVDAPVPELQAGDFVPFSQLRDMPLGMTAHILYTALDDQDCASLSGRLIRNVIRGQIGFDGLLLSDDANMKALSGPPGEVTCAVIAAGCDVALYCQHDGDDPEEFSARTAEVCEAVPALSATAEQRWQRARDWLAAGDETGGKAGHAGAA